MSLDALNVGRRRWLAAGAVGFALTYVALAIVGWGWGDWRGFVASPARAGACAAFVALGAATFLCGCNLSAGRVRRPENNWIFAPMFLTGLAVGWLPPYCDRRDLWTLDGATIRYMGFGIFLAGAALRIAAIRALGARHSVWVAVQPGHRLLTSGLYRHIRHPSYAGALMVLFGWVLVFRSAAGLGIALLMVPPIVSRMKAEEQLLSDEFGEAFDAYRRRSRRLVPFVY